MFQFAVTESPQVMFIFTFSQLKLDVYHAVSRALDMVEGFITVYALEWSFTVTNVTNVEVLAAFIASVCIDTTTLAWVVAFEYVVRGNLCQILIQSHSFVAQNSFAIYVGDVHVLFNTNTSEVWFKYHLFTHDWNTIA